MERHPKAQRPPFADSVAPVAFDGGADRQSGRLVLVEALWSHLFVAPRIAASLRNGNTSMALKLSYVNLTRSPPKLSPSYNPL